MQATRLHCNHKPPIDNNTKYISVTPFPTCNLEESSWTTSSKDLLGNSLWNTMRQWELEIFGDELLEIRTTKGLGLLNLIDLQNVNRSKSSSVSGSHVGIKRIDGRRSAQLAVLLVHVVGAASRIISDPHAKVLDLLRAFLVDLVDRDDLAVGLFHLAELAEEVPESRFGDHVVWCKDSHAV